MEGLYNRLLSVSLLFPSKSYRTDSKIVFLVSWTLYSQVLLRDCVYVCTLCHLLAPYSRITLFFLFIFIDLPDIPTFGFGGGDENTDSNSGA